MVDPVAGLISDRIASSWVIIIEMAESALVSCPILGVIARLAAKHDFRKVGFDETIGKTFVLIYCGTQD